MFGGTDISDKALLKTVTRRLERSGAGSQSGIKASVQRGAVTLVGKLKYENQRLPIVKAVRGVSGVRNVVDQLQSPPKVKPQYPQQGGNGAQH
jgi:osmotically-inducible protein OsmY